MVYMTSLLYRNEHLNCSEYALTEAAMIFKRYSFKKGKRLPDLLMDHSSIVFVLEGVILMHCGPFLDRRVEERNMFFLPNNVLCSGEVLEDTELLSCVFDKDTQVCNRFMLENLVKLDGFGSIRYDFDTLSIRGRLWEFVRFLVECLDDGLGCRHFHQMKRQELALLFRGYYTKEELARFFYPILSENMDFRESVLACFREANSLEEIARRMNLTPVTFNRRFKKTFGEPYAQWLEKRKAEDILRDILITNKTFSEIADAYGFSSAAYFTTFCKRHFGKSPSEIRQQRNERGECVPSR